MGIFDFEIPNIKTKMRIFLATLLMASAALAQTQQQGITQEQYDQWQAAQARQGFGGNVDASFGPFGSASVGGNLQLPGSGGDTGLLTTVLIGVGLLTLVNTIATVVVPMFNGSEEATPEETQRRARNIETVKGYVFQGLAKAAELYANNFKTPNTFSSVRKDI